MKYLYNSLLFCLIVFISITAKGQTDIIPKGLINPSFGVSGGDVFAATIAITNDNYTYIAGKFDNTIDFDLTADTFNITSTFEYNMFVAKYNKQSRLVFAFKLSGLSGNDNITAVTTDSNDNIYIAGYYANTVDFDPGAGTALLNSGSYYYHNYFFAKYDKNGNFIFVKQIVSAQNDRIANINSIKIDKHSNIFIGGAGKSQDLDFDPGIGVAHPESHGKDDAFFAKYDSLGNYVFVKAVGSSADDVCNGFTFDKNKNIILTGSFANATNDFDPNSGKIILPYKGGNDAFIAVYDSLGNYKYAFSLGGIKNDAAYGVVTDSIDNIIVSGSFYGTVDFAPDTSIIKKTSDADADFFLAKYTEGGKLIFVTTIRAGTPDYSPVTIDDHDNIYIGGSFSKSIYFSSSDQLTSKGGNDVFWAEYNATGSYITSNQIGGLNDETANSLILKNNNQLFVNGAFSDTCYFNATNTKKLTTLNANAFIASYNIVNNNITANTFGTYITFNQSCTVVKVAHDEQGNTYIAGTFQGIVDFDPGIGVYNLTSTENEEKQNDIGYPPVDIFFAKYTANGKLVFAKDIGGTIGQQALSIAVDDSHNIYIAGIFYGDLDADPGDDSAIFHVSSEPGLYRSYFIGKYDSSGNYVFADPLYISNAFTDISLAVDKKGNTYIAGDFAEGYFDPANDTNKISVDGEYLFFAKYDNKGKFIYLKSVGQKNKNQVCYDIAVNSKDNIILCGQIQGSSIDFDAGPKTYYVNAGIGVAHFIAAYNADGNFLSETNSVSNNHTSTAYATNLRLDKNDNIIVAGPLYGTMDFDPGPDSLNIQQQGLATTFFAKYNARGKLLFVKTIAVYAGVTGGGNFENLKLAVDDKSNIYVSGSLNGNINFDPGIDTAFLYYDSSMHSGNNLFLTKYDSLGYYNYAYGFAPTDTFFSRGAFPADLWININGDINWAVNSTGKIDFYPGPDTFYYHPPFDVYPSYNSGFSFALVRFKQAQTPKPFNIFASLMQPDIDKLNLFNLKNVGRDLK
ncbi:MAG: hypothetical protein ABJB05_01960 [Parafilimonas sp.]